MPKFYFNIRTDDCLEQDSEGAELPSLDVAREEAMLAAREIIAEKVLSGSLIDGQWFEIADEGGTVLLEVPFKAALRLE